ncbi:Man1-Src1p-C-terminal domain-containing protein [Truncatella angustata]|uniref:Man1-Src1p-C-terminal domain-containing protein n=1 Tax=Truncatella angustata TaxID=152316 RepID=A0A9P8UX40_9PEZI|nr:Man1-Src1p-C-terminal domain-containing protein [Truncatella angustata]KAH6659998.1 Man1-Src1p-C-terminal domain-containing protein [Truncatella angustata]
MSDPDSLEYLQPGFDAKSLTIPRLRSVLVAHNINYPTNAKKAQLVEIFDDQVRPQAKRILDQRAKAKRSSKGISDAESSQETSNPFHEPEDLPVPPPSARARRSASPRKASARIKSEEPEHMLMPPARSPSKRTSPSRRQPPQTSDTDDAPAYGGSLRTPRARQAQPVLKPEISDEGFFRRESGAFSSENPFQSGSSPPTEKTPSSRRRTPSYRYDSARPSSSHSTRRRAEGLEYSDPDESNMSKSLQLPARKLLRGKTPDLAPGPAVDAGEEFTPEEQLELQAEQTLSGETAVVAAGQARRAKSGNAGTSVGVLLTTLLAVYAGWYRQEKIAIGYCDVGQTTGTIPSEVSVPEWAQSVLGDEIAVPQSVIDTLEPQCEPCPAHAYCYGDFSVRCEQDYILKPHPFSLGGVIPLPPTCEPDGEKVRRVQAVADRAIEELRERTAKFECGELTNEEGVKIDTPAIEEQELKQVIGQKKSKKMTDQEFDDLWGAAIGEIKAREEIKVESKENRDTDSTPVPDTYLSSTSLARIPLTCAVKRSIRLGLARHRLQIGSVILSILSALYGRHRYRSNRAANAQVPALVDVVLDRLANQKQLEEDEDDPWLFLPNLRDDVLRSVHKLSQREKIWQRVRAVVEQNSNVRTSQREGRSGEVGRAWEWIGPSAGDSARKRRSGGRVSWGAGVKSEEDTETPEKSYLHQKWEEGGGRPIY